jgi:6-phosphogluconolactonase
MASDRLISFASPQQMTTVLQEAIACRLRLAIAERGSAVFAVSGGSTPKALYQALSEEALDWSKVTVVLVDERWVDEGEEGSNATFVRQSLLQGKAATANFISLKTAHDHAAAGEEEVNQRLRKMSVPDVVVLGMGNDGHTASWFPHAEGLGRALAANAPQAVAIKAQQSKVTGVFLERMTLSLPVIQQAGLTVLMMQGGAKKDAFEKASAQGAVEDMPVRALLNTPPQHFWPCWAA